MLEAFFRTAIGKRCGALKPQVKAAGFVSAFVMYAVDRQSPHFGGGSLFALTEFLTKLGERGPTVPGVARWALKVFEEVLSLVLPSQHPAVVAASVRYRLGIPRPAKHAPMLDMCPILDLETLTMDIGRPIGMRFYASA